MASSISIRVYLLQLHRRRDHKTLPFRSAAGGVFVPGFVSKFVADCSTTTEDADLERSWYFEEKMKGVLGNSKGHIHYGTFGFESNIVDNKTKKSKYKRQTTDSEVLPLYYEFWYPPRAQHIFVVFQSFAGRSCVHLVLRKMQEVFEAEHPGFLLRYKKLMPNDSSGSVYRGYPVQKLTLIKKNVSSDLADQYSGARPSEPVNLEVSLVARRKGSVGIFGALINQLRPSESGVITHAGFTFDEATANVRVGGRSRAVGIFGNNSEAGVIDITESVKKGRDGHPILESIIEETKSILKEFQEIIGSKGED